MKGICFLMALWCCSGLLAQTTFSSTTISGMRTHIGKPANAWLPIEKGGVSYKLDINDIASNKLDTAFVRNDSLITVKAGRQSGSALPSGGGGTGGGISNGNNLTFSINADGQHTTIPLYTGSVRVTGVSNTTVNGGGMQSWQQIGDTTYLHYPWAPLDFVSYTVSIISSGSETGSLNKVKYGALFGLSNAATNIVALNNTGVKYARVGYNGGATVQYTNYTNANLKVLLTYNTSAPSPGNYTLLPTDTVAFKSTMDNFFNVNGVTNVVGVNIINEDMNIKHGTGYWNTSARNMLNLLRAGTTIVHAHGLKAYDGGLHGEILYYKVWEDFMNRGFTDSAASFAARAFPASTNLSAWRTDTGHGYRIRYADTLFAGLATIPTDGVTVHFYETVLNADSLNNSINPRTFLEIVRYMRRAIGKPVICNELGINNNTSSGIMSQLIDAVQTLHNEGDMEYVMWYSGNQLYSLANADGSLTLLGNAFHDKLLTLP